MKTFWMLIAILLVAGCSFLAWSAMSQARDRAEATRLKALAEIRSLEAKHESPAAESTPATTPPTDSAAATPAVPEQTAPVSPAVVTETPIANEEPAPASIAAIGSESTPAESPAPQGSVGAKPGVYDIAPSVIENQPDGSMLVDGKFKITGDGSVERPFDVPWDLLIGSEKTYNPTEKLTRIPQAVAMLDGKHVRLTGYVAFPMYVQEPRELLSMLNQWDGCCIGVPPTPYDAVEVTLKQTVNEDDRMATFGAVEGRFGVKPYVVGDWLVGLYIMDEGILHAKQFGGAGS